MRELKLFPLLLLSLSISAFAQEQSSDDSIEAPVFHSVETLNSLNDGIQILGFSNDDCVSDAAPSATSGESKITEAVKNYDSSKFSKEALAANSDKNTKEISADTFSKAFKLARSSGLLFFKYKGKVYSSFTQIEQTTIVSKTNTNLESKAPLQNNPISTKKSEIVKITSSKKELQQIVSLVSKDTTNYNEMRAMKVGDYTANSSQLLQKVLYEKYTLNSKGELIKTKTSSRLFETGYGKWLTQSIEYNIRNKTNIITSPPGIYTHVPRNYWAKQSISKKAELFERFSDLSLRNLSAKYFELKNHNKMLAQEALNNIKKYYGTEVALSMSRM